MDDDSKLLGRLVEACRVLAAADQGDLIWGHVSVRRAERPEVVYIKPAGMGLEEMGPDDVISVDLSGRKIAGRHPLHVEVFIHTEIMRARPEVTSVVHTHPPHAVAFGSLDRPLLPVGHEGALFCEGLPVFDRTSDLIVTPELGGSLARTLGDHHAALLRNHGIVTSGRSMEESVMTALLLEKACKVQLLAEAAGGPRVVSTPEDALAKRQRLYRPQALTDAFDYCVRCAGPRRGARRQPG